MLRRQKGGSSNVMKTEEEEATESTWEKHTPEMGDVQL